MEFFGIALLGLAALTLILTGRPAYAVLIFASVIGAAVAVISGTAPASLLGALPGRIITLLENDLLQAIPLYVLMGVLLNRIGAMSSIFKTLLWLLPKKSGAIVSASLGVGALLGPLSGSVGASVLALSKSVAPTLKASDISEARRLATLAVASTFGVAIPPSLVLILLGDAMLNAHTIAINVSGRADRVINTQDVLRGALAPTLLSLVLCLATGYFLASRKGESASLRASPPSRPSPSEIALSIGSGLFLMLLLGAVATGYIYAVEGAAAGALLLFIGGFAAARIRRDDLGSLATEAMAATGTLFAPLVAATTFTLVLRLLGTDRLIADWIQSIHGGETLLTASVLAAFFLAAFVLDAFELIFVAVPILIPPLLMRVPDAVWVSTLVVLTLQTSFILPPVGYAFLMTRGVLKSEVGAWSFARATTPYLCVQATVLALTLAFPTIVHGFDVEGNLRKGERLAPQDVQKKFDDMLPPLPQSQQPSF